MNFKLLQKFYWNIKYPITFNNIELTLGSSYAISPVTATIYTKQSIPTAYSSTYSSHGSNDFADLRPPPGKSDKSMNIDDEKTENFKNSLYQYNHNQAYKTVCLSMLR